MDALEFRERGEEMIDYIVDYLESLSQRRVTPSVSPGYLKSALSSTPPATGESFEKIMEDVEKYILPGLTHWQHPGFHGFFPSCSSFPAILANMLADTFGVVCFNWDISPSGSELEILMLDWYGKLIGLPNCFLRSPSDSRGAGIMFKSTSECIFVTIITARRMILRKLSHKNPSISKAALLSSLVAYCSKEAHSSMEKIALVTLVNIKILDTDEDYRLRGETLTKAIKEDKKIGLIPFYVSITLGTFGCGSCDPINEIGPVCREHGVWLNVDACYAGSAMMCHEYRHLLEGVEYASSFSSNPSHWMLVHMDCSVLYVRDRFTVKDAVIVDRTDLGYSFAEKDWGYPSKTEFRALELFFVMRNYGVKGLQIHIRNHVRLAKIFEDSVTKDERFELICRNFGIVCFRLKGSDKINKTLRKSIISSGKLYMTPTRLHGKYVIRFVVCTERACEDDIRYAWEVICEHAANVLKGGDLKKMLSSIEILDECYKYSLP